MIDRSFWKCRKLQFIPHKCKLFVPDSVWLFVLYEFWLPSPSISLSLLRSLCWFAKIYRGAVQNASVSVDQWTGFFFFSFNVGTALVVGVIFWLLSILQKNECGWFDCFFATDHRFDVAQSKCVQPGKTLPANDSCLSDAISTTTTTTRCYITEGRRSPCTAEGNDIRRNKCNWLSDNMYDIVCINSLNLNVTIYFAFHNVYICIICNYLKPNCRSKI